MVTASTKLDPYALVAKLRKSGKQASLWPEQPMQQQQPPPAESQSQEPKSQADEQSKPNEPAEKPGADNAGAAGAEPSNPQPPPEPKQSTAGEAPKQESKETSGANANASGEAAAAAEPPPPQPSEPKGKAKQLPPELEKQPVDARVTVEYDRGVGGSYGNHMPPPQHVVMSYNQARPSMSASYYAPAPAPMARPGPSQGYIDEQYTPSYYGRPSPYEPYYYNAPQPSPYRYQYQSAPSEDYYYSAPPQRSAFSPPRDGYGDMFNDENANLQHHVNCEGRRRKLVARCHVIEHGYYVARG